MDASELGRVRRRLARRWSSDPFADTLLIRAVHAGQPIVENYVGRQVPTAMVARNLERGSGCFGPSSIRRRSRITSWSSRRLYELAVVVLKRATGLSLPEAGRILSALATALAAWGSSSWRGGARAPSWRCWPSPPSPSFPLTIRYGRAFQPDAAMLGAVVAGLACWDRSSSRRPMVLAAAGWCSARARLRDQDHRRRFCSFPLVLVDRCAHGRRREMLAACSTLLPALLWYAWADHLVGPGDGSRASADNRSIWLGLLGPVRALRAGDSQGRGLVSCSSGRSRRWVPAWLSSGSGIARRGRARSGRDRLWSVWGISALAAMAFLAEKLHHEYYWLLLAPVAAVGVGALRLDRLAEPRPRAIAVAAAAASLLCAFQVALDLADAGRVERASSRRPAPSRRRSRADAWVVASRGAVVPGRPPRLPDGMDERGRRAERPESGESSAEVEGPLDLVEYYRRQGARYFADLGSRDADSPRKGLHDAVRRRYKVIVDRPEVIIADLADSGMHWNAN